MAAVPDDLEKNRRGRCRFDGRCGNCRGGVGAPAVGLFALDEGVAEEDDAVAVAEFRARGGRSGEDDGEGEEEEQGGAEEWAQGEGKGRRN